MSDEELSEVEADRLRDLLRSAAAIPESLPEGGAPLGVPASRGHGRSRTFRWTVGAAAAALVAVLAAVVVDRSTTAEVLSGPGEASTVPAPNRRCPSGAVDVFVFVRPTGDEADQATIATSLAEDVWVSSVERFDRSATLREFRRVFSSEPDLIASVGVEDLPMSVRATFTSAAEAESRADALRADPRVLRVQVEPCGSRQGPVSGSGPGHSDGPDPTAGPAPGGSVPPACDPVDGIDLGPALPSRFDRDAVVGVGGGGSPAGACPRTWEDRADPGSHVTIYAGGPEVLGPSVSGVDGDMTWGRVHEGVFVQHSTEPRWFAVGYGLTESEWIGVVDTLSSGNPVDTVPLRR